MGSHIYDNNFVIGDYVDVKSNFAPGHNSNGGRARITQTDPTIHLKYIIDQHCSQDVEEYRICPANVLLLEGRRRGNNNEPTPSLLSHLYSEFRASSEVQNESNNTTSISIVEENNIDSQLLVTTKYLLNEALKYDPRIDQHYPIAEILDDLNSTESKDGYGIIIGIVLIAGVKR